MSLSDDDKEEIRLLDEEEISQSEKWVRPQSYNRRWCLWTTANVLLLVAFTTANVAIWSNYRVAFWRTDFPDARKAIQYEERVFTGALTYDPDQRQVLRLQDAEIEYFGHPSPEIDRAWEELLHDEFPTMTEQEIPLFPDLSTPFSKDGKYHFEPDVFHSLHCLNVIRIELNPVLYNVSNKHEPHFKANQHISKITKDPMWMTKHLEHCLDRIRQSLMCHGDLAPSPLYTWPGFPLSLGRTGAHTCRKWEPIREWMNERARNGESLKNKHQHKHQHGDSSR